MQNATLTGYLPTGYNSQPRFVVIGSGTQVQTETQFWAIDTAYINTIGLKLLQGRNFSAQFATDSLAVIVNQTMANLVGYTANRLAEINIDENKYHIIGVVKDFNFNSLRDNVTPLVMVLSRDLASLSIKINTAHLPVLMEQIEKKWQEMAPGQHFEYSFMDDDFNALYSSELRMAKLFITFTTLAILIACLGLFGLAAYAAEQRNKEIGIRKVLGASVSAIVGLLSTDFIKLVCIAILIASPLAWWAMNKWFLQGFAYRTNISWWVLAIAAMGALLIAFVTVCFQSLKAALANPVESLRSE